MSTHISPARRGLRLGAGLAAVAVALGACAETSTSGQSDQSGATSSSTIVIGTTDTVISLDPAGSYDTASFVVQNQVFPFLMNTPYNSSEVEPDIATSAEFTSGTEYTVTLKEGLTWANGNELTASDVKFSFDRQLTIADANGPSSLLWNLDSVEVVDDLTVVFHLKSENDQTFPQVLSSPAGPLVDEEVFSATELTSDEDIVAANAFAGQYVITSYEKNSTIAYEANPDYQGLLGLAENDTVQVKYYTDSSNLKLDVQQGNIDVAYRSLSATDIEDLESQDSVTVWEGPGGEIRYIVFNFDTQPYGATTEEADEEKALAVRQAVADLIDREALSTQVYKGTYSPLYSYVPDGVTGATESLLSLYGDGEGGPDAERAAQRLEDAGVETPVSLSLQYNPDHYGTSSADEYALIKSQLESTGLFTVDLQSTEWTQYSEDRVNDVYPAYQLGWFPDYSDADNYLTPFFLRDENGDTGFLLNHYGNDTVDELIQAQGVETDPDTRTELIEQIQNEVAQDLPTIPLLQGDQVAVSGTDIDGITLDASFKFRYAPITKG